VRSTGVPSSFLALTIDVPSSSASATSGRAAQLSRCWVVTSERVNAESVFVPWANATASTGLRMSPETPSTTRPEARPDSRTIRTAIRATTAPMRPNRVRAYASSRRARNTVNLSVGDPRVTDAVSASYRHRVGMTV
jgi:hypothetical protein